MRVANHVRLIRLASKHNNLRTDVVEGWCDEMPKAGESFRLRARSLTEPENDFAYREVTTSPIQGHVYTLGNEALQFETLNSSYRLEILEEAYDE